MGAPYGRVAGQSRSNRTRQPVQQGMGGWVQKKWWCCGLRVAGRLCLSLSPASRSSASVSAMRLTARKGVCNCCMRRG
eukprot:2365540-Pleurochrysis_carterae.AAC.1